MRKFSEFTPIYSPSSPKIFFIFIGSKYWNYLILFFSSLINTLTLPMVSFSLCSHQPIYCVFWSWKNVSIERENKEIIILTFFSSWKILFDFSEWILSFLSFYLVSAECFQFILVCKYFFDFMLKATFYIDVCQSVTFSVAQGWFIFWSVLFSELSLFLFFRFLSFSFSLSLSLSPSLFISYCFPLVYKINFPLIKIIIIKKKKLWSTASKFFGFIFYFSAFSSC